MNYIDHLKIKGVLYQLLDPSVDEKIRTAILNLVGTAPTALDTLQEIALAILSGDSRVETILTTLGNKADKSELFSGSYADLTDKPTIPSTLKSLTDDTTHRLVTDTEKTTWNNKQNAISDLATIRSGAAAGATALLSETDPTVPAWAKAATKPKYTATEVGALPASTAIPSKTSDLTNDNNFISGNTNLKLSWRTI